MDFSFFYKIVPFVRAHKLAFGAGGAALGVVTVASAVGRRRAAAVGEKVVEKLRSIVGTPYIWGGRSERGLDCSGAVVYALRELGLKPKSWNASAESLRQQATRVLIPVPGDLVFYGDLFGDASHVMVYAGDGKVIGASGGGPKTTTVAEARARNAEVKLLPMDYRKDRKMIGRLQLEPVQDTSVGSLHMLGSM